MSLLERRDAGPERVPVLHEKEEPTVSDARKSAKPQIEELELSKETVQDLNENEAAKVQGGLMAGTKYCHSQLKTCVTNNVGC